MNHENMKMTEVGWIPKDWEVKTIGEVATSFAYGVGAEAVVYDGQNKYIRITDIDDESHFYSPSPITSPSFFLDKYVLQENDIVIARTGASVGKTYIYNPEDGKLIFAGFLMKMNVNNHSAKYVFYHTTKFEYYSWVETESQRTGQPGLNIEQLKSYAFALPTSPSEQRRIASVLSDTDSLIATLSRTIEKKRLVKQGAMQQLLTGKTRLKGFSGEWVEKEFKEIYKSAREGGTPDTSKEEYYANGNIYFVKIDDMKNKYVVKAESKISEEGLRHSSAWMIPRRSILFSNGATIGRVCITNVDLCTKQGILGIVPKEEFNVEYLYYLLSSDEFMREVTSRITIGTMPIVYLNKLNEIKLYLPEDPNEQFAISERLRTMDNEIASLEAELQKYKFLKQGMMQKLLTGQIRLK